VTHRDSLESDWETPINLAPPINTAAIDGCPCLAADGLSLYFSSNRAGGAGQEDLYVSRRTDLSSPWGDPVNLGTGVNSNELEIFPSISSDGLTLYFSRYRGPGNADIYVAADEMVLPGIDYAGWLNIGTGKDAEPGSFWSGLIDDVRVYEKGE